MGFEQTHAHVAAPARPVQANQANQERGAWRESMGNGWESRLYVGLRVERVPAEMRTALSDALGEAGVEMEHVLALVTSFLRSSTASRVLGDLFLRRLEAGGRRLVRVAYQLEAATQGYLAALEAAYPGVREAAGREDVWWAEPETAAQRGEPLELRLRRCGFAYRHVVAVHLPANTEAVTDYAAQLLHALSALPPAGVVPAGSLYRGLDELTATLQGYLMPNHVADLNDQTPGLLTGIARLYALDAYEDTSVESDIAWAHTQLAFAQNAQARTGTARQSASWAMAATREWRNTIATLEGLRTPTSPAQLR